MENRERYEFIVLRRGPPFPENFHFSLGAFELSRKAMLKEKQRKKQGKESQSTISTHEVSKRGAHSTKQEITKPTNDLLIRKFCTDIILVAAQEIDQEDEAVLKNKQIMGTQNDEIDFLADRGDGYLPVKDTMPVDCTREHGQHGVPDQNLPSKCYSEANIQELARNICQEAMYKALTIVAKENLEHIQEADCYHDNIATASNEELLPKVDPSVDPTLRPSEALDKPEEQGKKISKAELKEQKKHQRFQEKKAIAYIKMVNEKYKERNEAINKLLKDQAKEEKKRKEKEKKLQKHAQKVEKKEQKKKEKDARKEMIKRDKLEKRRKNDSHDEQTTNAAQRPRSFADRIRDILGCFSH